MIDINELLRPNIRSLQPYSSARSEFKGEASVFLDANENPYNSPYNRYPDPLQWDLKKKIARLKGVTPEQIFLGVGSDEPIDLLYRAFCIPTVDNVVAIDPSYGMYKVCADINNVAYRKVRLNDDFDFCSADILAAVDGDTKIVFFCSPNNPTGNTLNREEIFKVLNQFNGLVVIDEAYIDFSSNPSFLRELDEYNQLVILHTFSKAWGGAAIRLGMAFASPDIIAVFNKIKYPYNINLLTQQYAIKMVDRVADTQKWVTILTAERAYLQQELTLLDCIQKIYPSDANFLLVRVASANHLYNYLVEQGIIVRNRNKITLCEGCLRITVGDRAENEKLLSALKKYHN